MTNNSGSATASLTMQSNSYVDTDLMTIVFPKGTTLTSTSSIANTSTLANGDDFTFKAALSSTSKTYNYPTLLASVTAEGSGADSIVVTGGVAMSVSNIASRDATYSSTPADATRAVTLGPAGNTCTSEALAFDWTAVIADTKDWSSKSISPPPIAKRGATPNS